MTNDELKQLGYDVLKYNIKLSDYKKWEELYSESEYIHSRHKIFEHYASVSLLKPSPTDLIIDIAADESPFIDKLGYGFKLDLSYEAGTHSNKIGARASDIPFPNGTVDLMFLHCSFEHFEQDQDIEFLEECNRVLVPAGAVCILPFYTADEYLLKAPQPSPNTGFARFYDSKQFKARILDNLDNLVLDIYDIYLEQEYKFRSLVLHNA